MNHPSTPLRRWLPALAIMAVIYYASSTPSRELPQFGAWDFLVKKGGHFSGYALLGAAYAYAFALQRGPRSTWLEVGVAVGLALLYALSDEFHQNFTPGRTPSPTDIAIDTAGALTGASLYKHKLSA
jgi:VanZ family protein